MVPPVQNAGFYGPVKTIKNRSGHKVNIQSFSFGDGTTARKALEYEKKWDWASMTRTTNYIKETTFYDDGGSCTALLNQLGNPTKFFNRDKDGNVIRVIDLRNL